MREYDAMMCPRCVGEGCEVCFGTGFSREYATALLVMLEHYDVRMGGNADTVEFLSPEGNRYRVYDWECECDYYREHGWCIHILFLSWARFMQRQVEKAADAVGSNDIPTYFVPGTAVAVTAGEQCLVTDNPAREPVYLPKWLRDLKLVAEHTPATCLRIFTIFQNALEVTANATGS